MANQKPKSSTDETELVHVTEPAAPAVTQATEPASRRRVTAYDTVTGEKLPHPVPPSHLDGRFPTLSETPSSKAGK